MKFLKYFLSRTGTFILIILISMTAVFFLARTMPSDPVATMLSKIFNNKTISAISTEDLEHMRDVLTQNFGLNGSLWEQYTGYMSRVLFTHDFGVSMTQFPSTVSELIGKALPWTLGLLLTTTVLSWIFGNIIGLLAGFRQDKISSKILEGVSILLYPIPYYVLAMVMIMLFAYIWPIFPLTTVVMNNGWTWGHIKEILHFSFLPGISLILVNTGWAIISMKAISSGLAEEDYIIFAKMKGLSRRRIMWGYMAPNAMLPQVTALALEIGMIFSGSIIVEILFTFPGMGMLIYNAVVQADYNLMMGAISVSIIAVSVVMYVIDMIYPLLDPRVQHG